MLARFAEFYEEVARLKLAIRDGRLAFYLAGGNEPIDANGNDLAAMVSQRLKHILHEQYKAVKQSSTEAEVEIYEIARYAMAALADELFVLDLDWTGREAWEHHLLEQSLFQSCNAGYQFFVHLDELLKARLRTPLQDDLAAVMLAAIQLGFRGQHRGQHGAPTLKSYREQISQFLGSGTASERPAFPQAYQYRLSELNGARLAPLALWYRLAAVGLLIYSLISTSIWLVIVERFNDVFNGN